MKAPLFVLRLVNFAILLVLLTLSVACSSSYDLVQSEKNNDFAGPPADKLASSGLGVNGFLEFSISLDNSGIYFFFTSKLKIRYTYSIWFDEGIRNLDNYHQEFLATQISVGLGYSF